MTHAESQDLLLDLAYGELDEPRASELSAHLAGCDECRREKAALDEIRRATAPLREVEEPSAGFDERILQASRAQANLEHDGTLGKVIEVAGSVKPLGLDAARIDAHANVEARPARRRPRWMVRAAVGGSVAAAAALALVVSTTVQSRRTVPVDAEEYRIRVQPAAPQAVDGALHDAKREAPAEEKQAQAPAPEAPPAPVTAPAEKDKVLRRRVASGARRAPVLEGGGGGDAADSNLASQRTDVPAALQKKAAAAPTVDAVAPGQGAGVGTSEARASAGQAQASYGAARSKSEPAPAAARPAVSASVDAPGPDRLEASAQEARHGGNYPLAAAIYRKAAALRRSQDKDDATAAWDLAHAVECLAAAGSFDDAREVRNELAQLYPAHATPLSAARRALREVDPPVPAKQAEPNR